MIGEELLHYYAELSPEDRQRAVAIEVFGTEPIYRHSRATHKANGQS